MRKHKAHHDSQRLDFQSYTVSVVRSMPHQDSPWTEGLEFSPEKGVLIETSGSYPPGTASFIRTIDLATRNVLNRLEQGLSGRFVEGITSRGDGWLVTTYTDNLALEYNSNMSLVHEHPYNWCGWGLSHSVDGSTLYTTNGSSYVMYLDANTLALKDTKAAVCHGKQVVGINELESVPNFMGRGPALLGNVMNTRLVLVLDPKTATCIGSFDLSEGLETVDQAESSGFHVANGIAYLDSGNLVVTGKNWASMYEIHLSADRPEGYVSESLSSFLGKSQSAMMVSMDVHPVREPELLKTKRH